MKKMLIVGLMLMMSVALVGNVMAGGFGKGGEITAQPIFEVEGDISSKVTLGGFAGGVAGSLGTSRVTGEGWILFGDIHLDGVADAGAWAGSKSYRDFDIDYDHSLKTLTFTNEVGSNNQAEGMTGASFKIGVDGFLGVSDAQMLGVAAQGTVAIATMSNFGGNTKVIAGQGAVGGFYGDGFAGTLFGGANAEAGAGLTVSGYTNVLSGSFLALSPNMITEGVYSSVNMGTSVQANGNQADGFTGFTIGNANLNGGWIAGGGAVLSANQKGANATASGYYAGSGSLNRDYNANLTGSVMTSVSNYNDGFMHGQSSHAEAHMHITD